MSSKPEEFLKEVLDKINSKDLSKKDYDLIKRSIIAEAVRGLDDKYSSPNEFAFRMRFSTDYSDIDYFRKKDYDECREILDKLDFNTHTRVKVKRR